MKQKKKDKVERNWVLTYFPTCLERDANWFVTLSQKKGIRYFIVGKEICPTTRKLHFQGYISFKNGKTFNQTKKWFGLDTIRIKTAVAGDMANKTYCQKDGNLLIEEGTPLKQGKRTDIERALEIAKQTNSMRDVVDQVFNYQACRHTELWLKYKEKKRPVKPIEVIWIYGSSGSGKTRKVHKDNSDNDIFIPLSYKWWEGYDAHKTVLIDDFRVEYCTFSQLIRLLDIYPFRVEMKGGSRQIQFNKIYITAPKHPLDMYSHLKYQEDLKQLTRRITTIIDMDNI
jgi:hypothetical protein